jgi:predicted Abi (CAAX) family protease
MRVMLSDVTVCGEGANLHLETGREPVQICGTQVALVRFECVIDGHPLRYRVSHYNRDREDFSGETDIFTVTEIPVSDGMLHPRTALRGIETHKHNNDGWYVYGEFRGGEFVVQGLEPRALTGLDGACTCTQVNELDPGYETNAPRSGVVRKTRIQAQGRDYEPAAGASLLLLHVFGWRGGELGTHFTKGDRVDGHFATGRADVIEDPFTGRLKLDIEYTQLYCHNVEGIVSGCIKWHNYMGSLERGWMYTVPVYDMLLHLPDLSASHESRRVLDLLFAEIETMSFRMRSGDGNGLAPVNGRGRACRKQRWPGGLRAAICGTARCRLARTGC